MLTGKETGHSPSTLHPGHRQEKIRNALHDEEGEDVENKHDHDLESKCGRSISKVNGKV